MVKSFQDFFKDLVDEIANTPTVQLPPIHTVAPFPKCARCHTFNVLEEGNWCEQCEREHKQGYEILSMLGRLANGSEFQKGIRFHAVRFDERKAICGAEPGRRSVGWTFDPRSHGKEVTCPRCLKKLERMNQ